MELFIFARFHARVGREGAVAEALREVSGPTRAAHGCLFPKAEVLLGSDASEQRLEALRTSGRLGQFDVLHLATHGVMDAERAFQSALILAQDNLPDPLERARQGLKPYDGRLTGRVDIPDGTVIPPVVAGGILYLYTSDAELVALR